MPTAPRQRPARRPSRRRRRTRACGRSCCCSLSRCWLPEQEPRRRQSPCQWSRRGLPRRRRGGPVGVVGVSVGREEQGREKRRGRVREKKGRRRHDRRKRKRKKKSAHRVAPSSFAAKNIQASLFNAAIEENAHASFQCERERPQTSPARGREKGKRKRVFPPYLARDGAAAAVEKERRPAPLERRAQHSHTERERENKDNTL